jgi:CheY-like chemotaxis protein
LAISRLVQWNRAPASRLFEEHGEISRHCGLNVVTPIDTKHVKQSEGEAMQSPLEGLRVLVVEDEAMISIALQEMLSDFGCEIAGTAARVQPALNLARNLELDLAVLDINVRGERVDPVGDVLAARGVPFIFATGYADAGIPPRFKSRPLVEKPYDSTGLLRALQGAAGEGPERSQDAIPQACG